MPRLLTLPASTYQQFDADLSRDFPGEGYGGWQTQPVTLDLEHTAVVVMHAWEAGTPAQFPGWYRAVEYIPRAVKIMETVFPPLLASLRRARVPLYHVVGGNPKYYAHYPAHAEVKALAGPPPPLAANVAEWDDSHRALRQWRSQRTFVGPHNTDDCNRGFAAMTDFPAPARPQPGEPICEDAHQLAAVCRRDGVTHLVYMGFAINWCLLMSPGGMLDMQRRGALCSAIREATTAVENRESARTESHKEEALWRVALNFGLVFSEADWRAALDTLPPG